METVFLSLTKSDFQDLLAQTVNACLRRSAPQQLTQQGELLTVPQAAAFLSLSVPTVYGLIHKAAIPHMKRGKRVYFSRTDLMEYVKAGRVKTQEDFANDADAYLYEKRKGGKQ